MGVYCIIGLEIVFFTLVFWYLFLKPDTKPSIKENVWGQYENTKKSKIVTILNFIFNKSGISPNQFNKFDNHNYSFMVKWSNNSWADKLKALIISWM